MRHGTLFRWAAIAVVSLSGFHGSTVVAQSAPHAVSQGAIVALKGTPHLWIADENGVLLWAGDTRALANRAVHWGNKTEVTLDQLKGMQRAEPWLSAGLLKSGDPIYFVKWESNAEKPTLLHIQSIADLELFGINATNYGSMVVDKSEWERRFVITADTLPKGELAAATGSAAGGQSSAAAQSSPSGPLLIVTKQAVLGGRGYSEKTSWIVGEVRNDGAEVCGVTVSATFTDASGVVVAAKRQDISYRRMAPGVVWPFSITASDLPAYKSLVIQAVPRDDTYCRDSSLPVSAVTVRAETTTYSGNRFHAVGTVTNDTSHTMKGIRVIVWFVDKSGNIVDAESAPYGSQANVDRLEPGQTTAFDVTSRESSSSAWVNNIAAARAVAFAEPV